MMSSDRARVVYSVPIHTLTLGRVR
uniref:Uncharacterized protein n=1 Tax=Anguilla anguilla TaxID=7936 RepID=A0A0E9V1K9_ANGAN